MTLVVRRYTVAGPDTAELKKLVSAGTTFLGAYSGTVDIQVDDSIAGIKSTLDEVMLSQGLAFQDQNPSKDTELILCSPDGSEFLLTVDDLGNLTITKKV